MNRVSVFEGEPEKRVDLMPDTDDNMVWTLKPSQENVKAQHTAMYLVCRYKGTDKTTALKIPASAKKVHGMVWGQQKPVLCCLRITCLMYCHFGATAKVSGFKQPIDDAEWTITTLTHSVSPDSGFTTSLDLEVKIDEFEIE